MSVRHIIYRLEPALTETALPDGFAFVSLMGVVQGLRCSAALREQFGWPGTVKAICKLASGRRFLFALLQRNRIASYVWSTEHSPRYPIEPQSCVLGPLVTRGEMRGRGLATGLLRLASAQLAKCNYRAVYIDTSETNIASQKVITRAGFVQVDVAKPPTA